MPLRLRPLHARAIPLGRAAAAIAAAIGSVACAAAPSHVPALPAPTWDFRVVAPDVSAERSLADIVDRASRADVVVFGEQHDDPETHRAELELLRAIGALGRPVVLSLEMFERDVQAAIDDYIRGAIDETAMLARTRPWPRYASDYRPLVELAKARGWPVIAANVPRPMASAVARRGLAALDTLGPAERSFAARDIQCPDDAYRARFMAEMRSHGGTSSAGDTLPTAVAERYYLAQCVKDETMAESIVAAMRGTPNAIVLHFDGAFHSDFGHGTVARVRRRAPEADVVVLTAIPAREPAAASVAPHRERADFVIFTRRSSAEPRS